MLSIKAEINRFKRLRKGYKIKTHYAEYEYERLLYEYIIEKIDVLIKDLQEFAGEESED